MSDIITTVEVVGLIPDIDQISGKLISIVISNNNSINNKQIVLIYQ